MNIKFSDIKFDKIVKYDMKHKFDILHMFQSSQDKTSGTES
jgi:hypothetical protein